MSVLQSNFLTSLAADVRPKSKPSSGRARWRTGAYLRAGARLREACKSAKRGEWGNAGFGVPVGTAS